MDPDTYFCGCSRVGTFKCKTHQNVEVHSGKGYSFNCPENTVFDTGAMRYPSGTRYDLISPHAIKRLAETYSEGAIRYGDNNWRKGLPFSNILSHIEAHIVEYKLGNADEDHLAHALWGIAALIEQETTHPELDDLYFHQK